MVVVVVEVVVAILVVVVVAAAVVRVNLAESENSGSIILLSSPRFKKRGQ